MRRLAKRTGVTGLAGATTSSHAQAWRVTLS
jgi:hypothetical protein